MARFDSCFEHAARCTLVVCTQAVTESSLTTTDTSSGASVPPTFFQRCSPHCNDANSIPNVQPDYFVELLDEVLDAAAESSTTANTENRGDDDDVRPQPTPRRVHCCGPACA